MATPVDNTATTKPQKTSEMLSTTRAGTSPGATAAGPPTKLEPKRSSAGKPSDTKRKSDLGKPTSNEVKISGPRKKVKKPEEKEEFTEMRGRLDKLESLMEKVVEYLPKATAHSVPRIGGFIIPPPFQT